MELNREHFHAIISYNFQRQLSQQECLAELLSVFGNEAPHQSTISRWYGEFKRGRVSLSDDPRVGAPKTAVTQGNVDAVRKLSIEDRHVTYREIEASLKISKTSVQKILQEELGVRKLVSRWIPHLLTEEQKAARVNWCQKTLDRFNSGNSKNVYSILSGEEKPTKVIRSRTGHIATIPLNEQRTLRKINPERRIILLQDNASSHTAQKTRWHLTEENVELLDHPSYSPDLSPNDFFTFPKIKNRLRGQRFQSPEKAVHAFKNAAWDLPANEWNKCLENWFERMQMCINLQLAPVLSRLFQISYESGTLPQKWKFAHVQPIPKKGSKTDPYNYRPVYLERHDLISDRQYDFRHQRSTGDHLGKLPEEFCRWVADFFSDRKICVVIDGFSSSSHTGSVLAPTPFSDDSTLHEEIQSDKPISAATSSLTRDLEFNASKTHFCTLTNKESPPRDVPTRHTRLISASHPNRVELCASRTGRYARSFVLREYFRNSTNLRQFKKRISKIIQIIVNDFFICGLLKRKISEVE
ncbi:unnamed protein product [Acanthoscelides obtectus]|uniref:Transposase n=1 Tax=Acanthoscelides obtectus TaxID=200917 RepID=A0A9P0KZD9_ACAOB|nr:unnamed protein product [Acanthoscelides obtectus]CAK1623417.1 Histone-lysine N-methyltransferase SETMAR [Acanthoscelides obtectus]